MKHRLIIFLGLISIFSCTDDIVIPELEELDNTATITGYLVGGVNNMATAFLIESKVIDSTYISTETGYFAFYNVERGDYILKVTSANGKGSYKKYISINSAVKTLGDIYLSPFPSQIESVYPNPEILIDTNNSYYEDSIQQVSIYFNYAVEESSLVNSISLSPSLPFTYEYYSSTSYKILKIRIKTDSLFESPSLSISLDTTIETIYSENLDYKYVVTYSIDTSISFIDTTDTISQDTTKDTTVTDTNTIEDTIAPIILKTIPSDTSILENLTENYFYIYFGSLVNQGNVENALNINPPISSYYLTWDTDTDPKYGSISYLRIDPYGEVMTNTVFTISIDSGTVLNNDITLDSTISLKCKTKPLSVKTTYPLYGQIDVPTDTTVKISFSNHYSEASLDNRISISPALEGFEIKSKSSSSYYGYSIFLGSDSLFQPNTEYTVTVSDSITDLFGKMMLKSTMLKFTTGD